MENRMQVFNNTQFGDIRIITEGDKTLFCGTDVAKALGYSRPNDAIAAHCRCTVKRRIPHPQSPDKEIEMSFITEGDVYRLVARSKLRSAERFESWVFDDVIPSIRQRGAYMTPETIQNVLSNPDLIISLATQLKEAQVKATELAAINAVQEQAIADFEPIKQYVDTILESGNALTVTQIAADYDISAVRLNKILNEESVQRKVNDQWVLYNDYMGKGYTTSKTYKYTHSDGSVGVNVSTLWTQKGRLLIHDILRTRGITPIMDRSIS